MDEHATTASPLYTQPAVGIDSLAGEDVAGGAASVLLGGVGCGGKGVTCRQTALQEEHNSTSDVRIKPEGVTCARPQSARGKLASDAIHVRSRMEEDGMRDGLLDAPQSQQLGESRDGRVMQPPIPAVKADGQVLADRAVLSFRPDPKESADGGLWGFRLKVSPKMGGRLRLSWPPGSEWWPRNRLGLQC